MKLLSLVGSLLFGIAAQAEDIRIAVISDLNGSYGSPEYSEHVTKAIDRIIDLKPDLVISTGDMVAGQRLSPPLSANEISDMWAGFHQTVSDRLLAAGIPFAVTPGNHDASAYKNFAAERVAFQRQFKERVAGLPFADVANFPFEYSLEMNGVRLIALDVTTPGALGQAQQKWLADQLRMANSNNQKTIVFSHLPLFPFAKARRTEIIGDENLLSLFKQEGLDIYLSGHHHAFYPGVHAGSIYVSQANLGNGSRELIGATGKGARSFTMLELSDDRQDLIYALAAPDFTTWVDLGSLPEQITSGLGVLTRIDLVQ